MTRIQLGTRIPVVHRTGWAADSCTIVGDVHVGADSSIWYGAVLRADGDTITVGTGSNIQDGSVVHADPGLPVTIGDRVSVGHRAALHGCTIESDVLIGMGALVLNGARIGTGSVIAAGAVVLENAVIENNSLVAGVPGKVKRVVTAEERESTVRNAQNYVRLADLHRSAALQ